MAALYDPIPGANYWMLGQSFHDTLGLAPRITLASLIAFLCGPFINAYIMNRMKISLQGKNFSARVISGTIFGESVDSFISFPLISLGVISTVGTPSLMFRQVLSKTAHEILVLSLIIHIAHTLKAHEGGDIHNERIGYNVLRIFNI